MVTRTGEGKVVAHEVVGREGGTNRKELPEEYSFLRRRPSSLAFLFRRVLVDGDNKRYDHHVGVEHKRG